MAQISIAKSILQNATTRKAIAGLSAAGAVGIIANFEGFSSTAYLPTAADVPTIGYGQTFYADGRRVRMGDKITKEQAKSELARIVEADFVAKIAPCVKVNLTQGEFDAFVSLAYNIGAGAFCGSTLVKKLNGGDYAGACSEILRWNKQKGKVLRGLQNRRFEEYKLCMGVG